MAEKDDRMAYLKDLPEAPASMNVFFTKDGWNFQLTLRDNDEGKLFGRWTRTEAWLKENGFLPKPVGQQSQPEHKATSGGEGSWDNPKNFQASKLVVEIKEGKPYYKVAGQESKFPKYPVTVWPEVLEKAGFAEEKIPAAGIPLDGFTAHYIVNDKGNPAKVIRLEPTPFD